MKENPLRIGALVSGGGTNLQAVLDACAGGRIPGRVVFVGSDNPEAHGLTRAKNAGIPTFVTDYGRILAERRRDPASHPAPPDWDQDQALARQGIAKGSGAARFLASRAACEAALLEAMSPWPFDLLVLAGFMRLLSPYLMDRVSPDPFRPRIMNIHPAILPAFPGTDGYGDTFRHGCKVGGCTVHFVDYGEDSGPIIGQRAFPILPADDLESVKKKGLALEWELYPECMRLFAEGRLAVEANETGRRIVKILPERGTP